MTDFIKAPSKGSLITLLKKASELDSKLLSRMFDGVMFKSEYAGDVESTVINVMSRPSSPVTLKHRDLAYLLADDHTQYLLLTAGSGRPLSDKLYIYNASNPGVFMRNEGDVDASFIYEATGHTSTHVGRQALTGDAIVDLQAAAYDETSDSIVRAFRFDTTAGTGSGFFVHVANSTATLNHSLYAKSDADLCITSGVLKVSGHDIHNFYNGTFMESFNALATSDGATVDLELEQSGGGDLTMRFSDGLTTLDCTSPVQTIELTLGDTDNPTTNYIYIPQSTKVLTKHTTQWPAEEHIKVAFLLVPTAAYVAADGCYINQNWNDHRMGTDDQGHLSHLCAAIRLTMGGATWHSGVAGNVSTEYLEITGTSPSVVYWKSAAGVAWQMHEHTVPALDTTPGENDAHVVNWYQDSYHEIHDFADIVDDAKDISLSNKYFNLVCWCVANKTGEYAPLMVNLPNGSYVGLSNAVNDVDGFDVTTIPTEFVQESTTGFLICRLTCKQTPTGTWTLESTTDLRGVAIGASAGAGSSGGAITDFADNQFTIYNVTTSTKIVDWDLSGLTAANTRTITPADADMTLLSTTDYSDLTDGGDTTLHGHDVTGLTNWPTIDYSYVSGNDAATNITAAELEILSDGTVTALHDHDVTALNSWPTIDYSYVSGNDAATDVTAAQLEELSDGSETALHIHDARYYTETEVDADMANILRTDVAGKISALGAVTPASADAFLIEDSTDSWNMKKVNGSSFNYSFISGNDGGTGITAAELEELSDGSDTDLHIHSKYLLLSGGTLVGNLLIDTNSAPSLYLREAASATDYSRIRDEGTTCFIQKYAASGGATMQFAPIPADGSSNALFGLFRSTSTSGSRDFDIYLGDGTATVQHRFRAKTGDVNLCQQGGQLTVGGAAGSEQLTVIGDASFTAELTLPYLGSAPGSLTNGMIWMESDGLHIYYAGAEKIVAGV